MQILSFYELREISILYTNNIYTLVHIPINCVIYVHNVNNTRIFFFLFQLSWNQTTLAKGSGGKDRPSPIADRGVKHHM